MNITANEFNNDIAKIVSFLKENSVDLAKNYFNTIKYKYGDLDIKGKNSNLLKIIIIYYNISEFFTNTGASYFGILTKEEIIDNYYSKEFQDDLEKAIRDDVK